jgi:hypothetical protein
MKYIDLVAELRGALECYRAAIESASVEEKDDYLRVVGHAEQIASALERGDVENTKLSLYAFSRQVTDSFYPQPPEFKILDKQIVAIEHAMNL